MATTVADATLKVTIKEELFLNGRDEGSETTKSYTVDECIRFVKTCLADVTVALVTFGTAFTLGGSILDKARVKYVRITNLDALQTVELGIHDGASNAIHKLGPGQSYVLMTGTEGTFDLGALSTDLNPTSGLTDISGIYAHCYGGNAIDVEVFAASA